jgi:hypothetical protein
MLDSTVVKKRRPTKKAVEDVDAEAVEAPVKKTRARKTTTKSSDTGFSESAPAKEASDTKNTPTKKGTSPKVAAKSTTSKRTAKTLKNDYDVELDTSTLNASTILKEATAFNKSVKSTTKEMTDLAPKQSKAKSQLKQVGSVKIAHVSEAKIPSTTAASHIKPTSFLSSFLKDSEPTPVPPPQTHHLANSKEGRADLRQATKPAFEDSILTSAGKVKDSTSPGKTGPSAATGEASSMTNPPTTTSSQVQSQLRAFTTTSFSALKGDGKSSPSISLSKPSTKSSKPATGVQLPSKPQGTRPPLSRAPPETPFTGDIRKSPAYRSLYRKWMGVILASPIAIYTSYELWRRWQAGELVLDGTMPKVRERADEMREGPRKGTVGEMRMLEEGILGERATRQENGAAGPVAAEAGMRDIAAMAGPVEKESAGGGWKAAFPSMREGFARPGSSSNF